MKRKNITADGRDLSEEEWRVIPEFPRYEITADGDVRNKETQFLLQEQENIRGGSWYYNLYDGKKTHSRGFWGLVYSAFPENRPDYSPDWITIPGHPGYQINKEGTAVRIAKSQKPMKIFVTPFCNIPYVQLTTNRVKHTVKMSELTGKPDTECDHAPNTKDNG